MTERPFSRLRQTVAQTIQAQRNEQSEDSKSRAEEKRKLMAIVAEYHYLKSSPVIDAMKDAGLILNEASHSDVLMYITKNPEPENDRDWEWFYREPSSKLDTKISVALIWDIRDEDLRGRGMDKMEWKEIVASVNRNQSDEIVGFRLDFGRVDPIYTDLSRESIFEGVDQAASLPVLRKGKERYGKDYEHLRVKFQSLYGRIGKDWKLEDYFKKEEAPKQPQRQLFVR
jgi:hypothetical protein